VTASIRHKLDGFRWNSTERTAASGTAQAPLQRPICGAKFAKADEPKARSKLDGDRSSDVGMLSVAVTCRQPDTLSYPF